MLEKLIIANRHEDQTSPELLVQELASRKNDLYQTGVMDEIAEDSDLVPKLGEVFVVGCAGELIKGTVVSVLETELGRTIILEDITEPLAYIHRHGTFTYSISSGRWEVVK